MQALSPASSRYTAAPSLPAPATSSLPEFAGQSPTLREAIRQATLYARFEHATILIDGESGTGKSYVARHIHASSPRARAPFHQVVLSTLDDGLAASDLFGHLSGSYTDARSNRPGHFVTANQGTLFLDEIGKATRAIQHKLLHAIEHREITPVGADRPIRLDVRLVAATNIPLGALVQQDRFAEDLASRLATFRVRLPALRERREDIPALVRQFLALRAPSCGHPVRPPRVHATVMKALERAEWPGNLRQLDGVVQRLLVESADGDEIGVAHCAGELGGLLNADASNEVGRDWRVVRERHAALGSVSKVARELGVSRWTVYRDLERAKSERVGADVAD